jgi:hypothetical protein
MEGDYTQVTGGIEAGILSAVFYARKIRGLAQLNL